MFGLNRLYTIQARKKIRTDQGGVTDEMYDLATHVLGTIQVLPTPERIARFGAANVNAAKLFMVWEGKLETSQFVKDEDSLEVWRISDVVDAAGRSHHAEVIVERVQ